MHQICHSKIKIKKIGRGCAGTLFHVMCNMKLVNRPLIGWLLHLYGSEWCPPIWAHFCCTSCISPPVTLFYTAVYPYHHYRADCQIPLMATLKSHSSGPSYSNSVIGTLAVDGRYPSIHHYDIWYSEEGPVPNVTDHPSVASVPTSYYLMWQYNCLCTLKVVYLVMCVSYIVTSFVSTVTGKHLQLSSWNIQFRQAVALDHAVKFARWQHPAVACRAMSVGTSCLVYFFVKFSDL